MQKTIDLQYYARFRELRGRSSEFVTTTAATPRELFEELGFDRSMPVAASWLKVAINAAFATWDDPIENGDVVVFMTPMAGG
jgi:molybdopterin converting factor small subunit